jgi:hypothetical protein
VLHGEGPKEEILADSPQLEEVRAEAPALANLLGECPVSQLRRDRFSSDEDFSDPAPHQLNLAGTAPDAG